MCRLHFRTPCVFVCVTWLLESKPITSLNRCNGLVFVIETQCVFCEVGNKFLINNYINLKYES